MWKTGDQIIKRFVPNDRITWVVPITIVDDTHNRLSYFVASGTPMLKPVRMDGSPVERSLSYSQRKAIPWKLGSGMWTSQSVLWTSTPGEASDVGMFFAEDFSTFNGWYVNLQDPFRRTALGFDTADHILDIQVSPDGTWVWKDRDEFEEAHEFGRFSPDEAAAIEAEGERMIGRIERAEWPFEPIWDEWNPDPAWTIPGIPTNWNSQ